jgi:hypothetical protein
MKTFKCTETGMKLYNYFLNMDCIMSTDSKFENYLPGLNLKFSNPNDIEDFIIKMAVKIRKEQVINEKINEDEKNHKNYINPDTDSIE